MKSGSGNKNFKSTNMSHVSREGGCDFIYNEEREYNPYSKETNNSLSEEVRNRYEYGYRKGETEKQRQKRIKQINKNKRLAEKESKHKERSNKLDLTGGKVFSMVVTSLVGCGTLSVVLYGVYFNQIRYPSRMVVDCSKTGMYCLNNWMGALDSLDGTISSFIGEESYLEKEVTYANSNELRVQFFEKMLSSVEYIPDIVEEQNKYGNIMIDRNDAIVFRDSYVTIDEEVTLKYVDYSKIEIDKEKVKQMMSAENLKLGDAGYSDKLTDIFCKYMLSIEDLPKASNDSYIPNFYMNADGTYGLFAEEDVILDKILFSSAEFYDLLERFSLAAGSDSINPEWNVWYAYPEKTKAKTEEPVNVLEELPLTDEWVAWNSLENKKPELEPDKYFDEYVISNTWCGAYYLTNEYVEYDSEGNVTMSGLSASLGDGTKDNPASMGTEVVTVVKNTSDKYNDGEDYPISVRMVEYGVSEDAIAWFESKDERNRGHDIKSEVQYVYYVFEVKNLSNYTLRVRDNSTLCDSGVNLSARTGVVYGLTDNVTLKPGEIGYIESWSSSINLNKKYVIWGANFSRENDVVWFRRLAGDLEDTTENKGVTINSSRLGETEVINR